jgi:hypothetical protein
MPKGADMSEFIPVYPIRKNEDLRFIQEARQMIIENSLAKHIKDDVFQPNKKTKEFVVKYKNYADYVGKMHEKEWHNKERKLKRLNFLRQFGTWIVDRIIQAMKPN